MRQTALFLGAALTLACGHRGGAAGAPAPVPDDAMVERRDGAAADAPGQVADASPPADTPPLAGPDGAVSDGRGREDAAAPGDAQAPGPYVVEGLGGDVTAREVAAFIGAVSVASIPTAQWVMDNPASHNILCSFGRGGITLEALNLMVEVTRAARMTDAATKLVDVAIKWTDAWLVHRNDLPQGEHRVMWTGKVDPIWPPNHPADLEAAYAGSETGDTVGILAHTALSIASDPALAASVVPDGDPNHFGRSYGQRLATYVSMLEASMDGFFVPNFIDPATSTIHHPDAPAYAIPGTPGGSQNVNAWNRMMLFMHSFQTLGQVHHLLGDDPAKDALYHKVVENAVDAFVATPLSHPAADGTTVYDWGYGNFGDIRNNRSNEDISHGQIDMIGLTRAYRAAYTSATANQMKTFADTVVHEILISPGVYAGSVNRAKAKEMATTLPAGWLLLSPYNHEVFTSVGRDLIASGRQTRDAGVTAYLLWAKQAVASAH